VDVLKLFHLAPVADEDPETRVNPDDQRGDDLESEFQDAILEQLARGGVTADCVAIDVRPLGRAADGRQVYLALLRLTRWEETSAVRLLLGLPLLQAKIRKAVQSSWLDEVAHFSGLWVHPSGQFEETAAMNDLRNMIVHLEQVRARAAPPNAPAAPEQSVWSLPQELAGPPSKP
jgi:hypothetical protein